MRIFTSLILCSVILSFLLGAGCSEEVNYKNPVVASYGDNHEVTFTQLNKYVNDWMFNRRYPDKLTAYQKGLETMVVNYLKRMDFFERGLDRDTILVNNIRRIINEELVIEYYGQQYEKDNASNELIEQAYKDMQHEVVYKQIVFLKPLEASEEQLDSLEESVMEIKEELQNGADFGEYVIKYSQDEKSAQSGGFMPPLNWRESLLTKKNNVIFNSEIGQLKVLEDNDAFFIITVTDKNNITVKPLNEVRDEIVDILSTHNEILSYENFDKDKIEAIKENEIKWNDEALNRIVKWSSETKFYSSGKYVEKLQSEIAGGNNFVILEYHDRKINAQEFLRLLNDVLLMKDHANITKDNIQDYFVEALRTDLIIKKANELDLVKNIFNPNTENESLKDRIVYLYNKAVIDSQIPEPTEQALKEFYESQKDSLYYQLEKINAYIMYFPAQQGAEEARKKIDEGTAFEKIRKSYWINTYIKTRSGEIQLFRQPDKEPLLGEEAFSLAESEIAGPFEHYDPEKGNQFVLIKCAKRIPEKQLTYQEVQGSIKEDFISYHRNLISQKVSEELWDKYDAEIYDDVLAKKAAMVK